MSTVLQFFYRVEGAGRGAIMPVCTLHVAFSCFEEGGQGGEVGGGRYGVALLYVR